MKPFFLLITVNDFKSHVCLNTRPLLMANNCCDSLKERVITVHMHSAAAEMQILQHKCLFAKYAIYHGIDPYF